MKPFFKNFLLLLVLGTSLAGCSFSKTSEDSERSASEQKKIKIVTTFAPLYSFAANIAGDTAEISNLVPIGASEHTWQPKPSDIKAVAEADLLIMNGLKLEEFLPNLIDAASNTKLKIVDTSIEISLLEKEDIHNLKMNQIAEECRDRGGIWVSEFSECENVSEEFCKSVDGIFEECSSVCRHTPAASFPAACSGGCLSLCRIESEYEAESEEEHHHEGSDPHIWLSLPRAQKQGEVIRDALKEIDPSHSSEYEKNAKEYNDRLEDLYKKLLSDFQKAEKKRFIAFHDAYRYFFHDMELEEYHAGSISDFEGKEPSPEHIKEIADLITKEQVHIIFTEPQFSPKIVETLKREYGIHSYSIDPIGAEISPEGYEKNMTTLAEAFSRAFREPNM